jgi:hypothetical protein
VKCSASSRSIWASKVLRKTESLRLRGSTDWAPCSLSARSRPGMFPPSPTVLYEGQLIGLEDRLIREIVDDHVAVIVGRGAAQILRGRPVSLQCLFMLQSSGGSNECSRFTKPRIAPRHSEWCASRIKSGPASFAGWRRSNGPTLDATTWRSTR